MRKIFALIAFAFLPALAQATPSPAVTASNNLNYKLFGEIVGEHEGENIFISPYSIFSALNLTYAGAAGATKSEFEALYSWPAGVSVNSEYLLLNQTLQADRGSAQLLNANALWVDKQIALLPDYLAVAKTNYLADASQVDFTNAAGSAKIINQWVADNTKDKITQILSANDLKHAKLVLTNAIYFYGSWLKAFDKSLTKEDGFTIGRTAIKVPLMHDYHRHLKFLQTDSAQLAELPYKDSSLAMLVVLPNGKTSIALQNTLASLPQLVDTFDKNATNAEINALVLPKFKFESGILDLVNSLKKLGLNLPFNPAADFSGITKDTNLMISKILHKAVVEVNEDGTEAAASTAVAMVTGSAMIRQKPVINFIVDHPFFFLIRDSKTGLILFSGLILDPTK